MDFSFYISEYGLLALSFILFIDDLGIAIFPSSSLVFFVALFAHNNPESFSLPSVLFVSLFFPVLGNNLLFFFGKHGARKFIDRHGSKFFLPPARIDSAEKFLKKYGEKMVIILSFTPGLRQITALATGSLRMNWLAFFIFNLLGVIVWGNVLVFSGYFLGREFWIWIKPSLKFIFLGIILYSIFHFLFLFFRKNAKRRDK